MIETGIVRELARDVGETGVQILRAHVERKEVARKIDDRTEIISLSGAFHVELARCHENSVPTRVVRELVTRASLIVALFGTNQGSTCPDDVHVSIIDAIVSGDPQSAEDAIRHHLLHVQTNTHIAQT